MEPGLLVTALTGVVGVVAGAVVSLLSLRGRLLQMLAPRADGVRPVASGSDVQPQVLAELRQIRQALEELDHTRAAVEALSERLRRDPDQTWFWTPEWQEGEREADADYAAGRSRKFDTTEAFFEDLDLVPQATKVTSGQ